MDKDDLFNVQESLQSPEEELKKQNDKKKMKVEVYVIEGVYDQLRGFQKMKQQNFQDSFIIPTPLIQANVAKFLELSQKSIENGHKFHNIRLNKQSIDNLIDQFRESEKQKPLQNKTESQSSIHNQEEIPQQNAKQMIFRSINQQKLTNTQDYKLRLQQYIQSTKVLQNEFVLNRMNQIFKF